MNVKDLIIFEDENILILNKPRGILLQQDGSNNEFLDIKAKEYLPNNHVGPIHRLDKNTSGLVIFGKNEVALKEMSALFTNKGNIEKHYLTLVHGHLENEGEIIAPIRKNFQLKKMVVAPIKSGAKEAITQYKVIEKYTDYSLLDVNLITGRTHQIRVHMSYIRHHVVGDEKYGDYKINNLFKKQYAFEGQFLHSFSLKFGEIRGKMSYLSNRIFKADMPEEMKKILENLTNL